MKNFISVSGVVVALLLVACEKVEYRDMPALGPGECHLSELDMSLDGATAAMNRLAGILEDSTLGSYKIPVISKKVFEYKVVDGKPVSYGFQIVFGCKGADVRIERQSGYSSEQQAHAEGTARANTIKNGRLTKLLDVRFGSDSWKECDTCCVEVCDRCEDDQGYYACNCRDECWDCNCETFYEYYWVVRYVVVDPNNLQQAAFLKQYEEFSNQVSRIQGSPATLTDTLAVAKKVLPAFTESGALVRDWHKLFSKINVPAQLPAEKSCSPQALKSLKGQSPNSSKLVKPSSRHFVQSLKKM